MNKENKNTPTSADLKVYTQTVPTNEFKVMPYQQHEVYSLGAHWIFVVVVDCTGGTPPAYAESSADFKCKAFAAAFIHVRQYADALKMLTTTGRKVFVEMFVRNSEVAKIFSVVDLNYYLDFFESSLAKGGENMIAKIRLEQARLFTERTTITYLDTNGAAGIKYAGTKQ